MDGLDTTDQDHLKALIDEMYLTKLRVGILFFMVHK